MFPKQDPFRFDVTQFGIVTVSVANLRQHPLFQSELIDQLILGSVVPVFEEQNDFYLVQNWDGYRGWLSKASLVLKPRDEAQQWHNEATLLFIADHGWVRCKADLSSEPLTDLVLFANLKERGSLEKFSHVELPDGRRGYIPASQTDGEVRSKPPQATGASIVSAARRFLGVSYLWGGTSPKAFDCSGLVQTVFRLQGLYLPRDANQVIELGEEIPIGSYDNLRAGDLLFFGKTQHRITHVAIYMSDSLYIHADGRVRINSLEPANDFYNEHRHKTLLTAKRLI
ncbi:C40 family peptidase [candidate division KSB1 bacterium]|nr:C40 family peptidase [candidate division KSB1 bacterium]NIR70114.1 C40 family peptidase [candidate division KSB1 bacterium]NIS27539.1 C40 family peptidase [candidate division KSB1 bacterium]NIT74390.1 C40 family peptidase [candidate division KSB1 bacterium]NIU28257.1 C40 family peptidase [candidate division KSB1 bacterium]